MCLQGSGRSSRWVSAGGKDGSPYSKSRHSEELDQEIPLIWVMKMSDRLVSRSRWLNEVHRECHEAQAGRNGRR